VKIKKNKFNKGFTLIELLVVVAIIGLLASVVLASMTAARSKARDATRLSDIHQIQIALELYHNTNGVYPPSNNGASVPTPSWSNSGDSSWDALQTSLSPYLHVLPKDPINDGGYPAYTYSYYAGTYGCVIGTWYVLEYSLENGTGPDIGIVTCNGTSFKFSGSTKFKTVGMVP
jgi:type II secretion system protein G